VRCTLSCTRSFLILCAVVALLILGLPCIALGANPGDGPSTAVTLPALPWSSVATGTLIQHDPSTWWFWYRLPLVVGQTINMTATVPPGSDEGIFCDAASFETPMQLGSDYVDSATEKLTLIAPRTGDYFVVLGASSSAAFSLDATIVPAVPFSLSSVSAPRSVEKKKKFSASVTLRPDYDSVLPPIRFYFQHKVGKKWRASSSKDPNGLSGTTAYSTFVVKNLKISKAGVYRVRARFSDAAHPARYTKWKTIIVVK